MKWRRFGLGLMALLWLGGCARGGPGLGDTLNVGQRVEELVARQGQPQEMQPEAGGGQTYIYTTSNLDQMGTMGGGAWAKPDQVYYRINDQGVITEVNRYPYGKRNFIFPAKGKPTQIAQAPVAGGQGTASLVPQAAPAPAAAPGEAPRAQVQPPGSPTRSNVEGASRLELNMSREEVRRVLGPPERTEGCRMGGRAVIVWYYLLEGPQGRRGLTPLVFEEGRLSGWGDNYYRRRLREVSGQQP
jgi:hypothetical protein